jgi:hypothetical protein
LLLQRRLRTECRPHKDETHPCLFTTCNALATDKSAKRTRTGCSLDGEAPRTHTVGNMYHQALAPGQRHPTPLHEGLIICSNVEPFVEYWTSGAAYMLLTVHVTRCCPAVDRLPISTEDDASEEIHLSRSFERSWC